MLIILAITEIKITLFTEQDKEFREKDLEINSHKKSNILVLVLREKK